eukprot:1323396-Amorphochlora_amoeboformis.AAC.1
MGFKCVISTSFADIFYNNCFKNGILPIKVTEEEVTYIRKPSDLSLPSASAYPLSLSPFYFYLSILKRER